MNVRQLKNLLNLYPDDMHVIMDKYSDWKIVDNTDFSVVEAVVLSDNGWAMHPHSTMSEENRKQLQLCLKILGN